MIMEWDRPGDAGARGQTYKCPCARIVERAWSHIVYDAVRPDGTEMRLCDDRAGEHRLCDDDGAVIEIIPAVSLTRREIELIAAGKMEAPVA